MSKPISFSNMNYYTEKTRHSKRELNGKHYHELNGMFRKEEKREYFSKILGPDRTSTKRVRIFIEVTT